MGYQIARKGFLAGLFFVCILGLFGPVHASISIDFNDGTPAAAIDGFYSELGVTFSNAAWKVPSNNQVGTPSSGIFLVDVTDTGWNPPYSPQSDSPIIGMFSSPQSMVSVLAVDVGKNGVTMDAYDAVAEGNLIGTDSFTSTGSGVGVYHTLSIESSTIRRFEIYQQTNISGDGIFFDNLLFEPALDPLTLVTIDIKPGSDLNSINLGSNGNIPVAIFSTDTFDATTVDPATILLAYAGVKERGKNGDLMSSFEDIDIDGLDDLLIHIDTQALVLSYDDVEAQLTGETFDGLSIVGTDAIRIVPPSASTSGPGTLLAVAVPEPSTFILLITGIMGLIAYRRNR